ncbi:type II toxin-antitoxin system HipA family toxin [Gordonia sp. (in: high G+C Gram-positive bacteria)]|jgi:serine/threonine-protein kinase HipA|uniref:type II toxin-antitoxin system HipA family toxin n=1 Tax=Gordonia sp. (in: high G+C Gram-positive bacteria) TaxID=84139 RepID=UPI001E0141A2|nr:type II toxin-antitoxin system HipA family toxin [Gordonia sp. (in: high G+C Gram-positive bacteria)]MCB1293412.1 type II toxin-antitoxin system HipA family toxin [Gordonia sp. (in: high G+C Gram-positive bacteria)]HMS74744.1 type II toxin-antitoxin system HipA family toxin [Gordonia sp. (in: high G+C Gram-positive bacteria)]
MTTPDLRRVLYVVMNGQVIGDVQRTGKQQMRLRYDADTAGRFTPLSVSMPGPAGRYRENAIGPWLEGLLPDRPETLRQWRRQFGIAADTSPFALLRHVGEDVAGAAQFVRPERLESVLREVGALTELSAPEIADMLRRALADLPTSATDSATGKFSLAGAQAKIALHRTVGGWSDPSGAVPSTHIVKPAIPTMPDQDLVEVVTMRAASALGLRVALCGIEHFDDERAIVIERYDRVEQPGTGWMRVHQEDMCQALRVAPFRKYESQGGPGAIQVADLIRRVSDDPGADNRRFAQALVFNWLVCGTDAHARNYSLLISGTSVRLAPLYDLNSHLAFSTGSGNDLSMSIGGTFRASRLSVADWLRVAPRLHVDGDWLAGEIARQAREVVAAVAAAAEAGDIVRYESAAMRRLVASVEQWVQTLLPVPESGTGSKV